MNRKDFLKLVPAAGMSVMINGFPVRSLANAALNQLLGVSAVGNNNVIVLIQLIGGNDGINTVIPLDQYSALTTARSNILIPEKKVLPINGSANTGFHPSMGPIRTMYDQGMVSIVQGVSYPNPNFSHFRATDIWLTGSDSGQSLNNGWVGRYLSSEYNGYPQGYPNQLHPDPPAIEIGTTISTCLIGQDVCMGTSVTDVSTFYNLITNTVGDVPDTPAGHELSFLRFMAQQTQQYTSSLQKAAGKAKNLSDKYPDGNLLADQLKIVARLIGGGMQTQVYVVSIGSFDTHAMQAVPGAPDTGIHADLLTQLSDAVNAFFDDCRLLKVDDRVCAMTFSEFGRRIISNGAAGTDHGTSGPVFVFGKNVIPGIIGTNPVIPANATDEINLDMQYDYRNIYAAVLEDWLGAKKGDADSVLNRSYAALPIFNAKDEVTGAASNLLFQNYPNPVTSITTIKFISHGGPTAIILRDNAGRTVKILVSQDFDPGVYEVSFSKDNLPSGNYYYTINNGSYKDTMSLVIAG
jgi:uncharacterized protein (DUF1501 family)